MVSSGSTLFSFDLFAGPDGFSILFRFLVCMIEVGFGVVGLLIVTVLVLCPFRMILSLSSPMVSLWQLWLLVLMLMQLVIYRGSDGFVFVDTFYRHKSATTH